MLNSIIPIQCVSDVCNLKPPLSTKRDASLPLVVFYMNLMKVDAAAIVDENNHCIGFVTCDDVTDHVCDEEQGAQDPCIGDVMRTPNMSVYLDDPIGQALNMMNLHNIDWLPVVNFETQHFSGLVYREDIEHLPSNIIAFSKGRFSYGAAA